MHNVLQYWFKRFNNKLQLPPQSNKLDYAPLSASRRALVPEIRGGVTTADAGHYHRWTVIELTALMSFGSSIYNICLSLLLKREQYSLSLH